MDWVVTVLHHLEAGIQHEETAAAAVHTALVHTQVRNLAAEVGLHRMEQEVVQHHKLQFALLWELRSHKVDVAAAEAADPTVVAVEHRKVAEEVLAVGIEAVQVELEGIHHCRVKELSV
jgi:hypothetical protein